MRSRLSPLRLAVAGAILLVAVFAYMVTQKSDKLLEVPDKPHSLNGIVSVPGMTAVTAGFDVMYLRKICAQLVASMSFAQSGSGRLSTF